MQKKICLLLACVMLFTVLFAGCSKDGGDDSYYWISVDVSDETVAGDNTDASGTDSSGAADETDTKTSSGNTSSSTGKTSSKPTGTNSQTNTGGKIYEASFVRNEDGTCTDKKTGVVFMDDDLSNWDKVLERGSDLQFDDNDAALMEGDTSRAVRKSPYNDCWFSYKFEKGITEVGIVTYYAAEKDDGSFTDVLEFYVSKDNKTWTKVTGKTQDIELGFKWYRRTYKITGIDKSNIYFKIVIAKPPTGGHKFNPNIGRLRINNIDKMDDEDRYLEGRASATFYVDSKNGSDNNDGTSPEKAFKSLFKASSKFYQPGDKILLKSGSAFSGSFSITGYGTADAPITVGTYGGDERAKISARSGTAVTVKAKYININNLEVTNANGTVGIYVMPLSTGKNTGVTIEDCYIHDVNTKESSFEYETGGIIVYVDGAEPTWFDSVTIKNNTIKNVARTGILFTTQWAYRPGVWGHEGYYKNDNDGWYVYTNSKVVGNTVDSAHGDGIFCCGAKGILIEKNVVTNAFSSTKAQTGVACAALWTTNTNDAIIQYNDVGYTNLPIGGKDGEGFDIDISSINTTIQYNYSHNNDGGFLLMCNLGDGVKVSKNHTVRFNLSVNDAVKSGQGVFMMTDSNPGTQIYNNTIYVGGEARTVYPIYFFNNMPKDVTFTNNIFYGETTNTYKWSTGATNFKFVNNIFAGGITAPSGDGYTVSGSKTDDPQFANRKATDYENRAAMIKAFTPKAKISGATAISNNGGKDINGTSIGSSAFYGAVKY